MGNFFNRNQRKNEPNLEDFESFDFAKNPTRALAEYLISPENYTEGFIVIREIAAEMKANKGDWDSIDWAEVQEELAQYNDLPLNLIFMYGVQAVMAIAANRYGKKRGISPGDDSIGGLPV